jgi:multidrug resistance efflux pump
MKRRPLASFRFARTSRAHASRPAAASAVLLLLLVGLTGCGAGGEKSKTGDGRGVVVVNAPVAGEVRRVLVSEGAAVGAGDPVVEIVVSSGPQQGAPSSPTPDPVARAAQAIQSSEAEIEAARSEVVRAEVEVQRIAPLVSAGQATQGQLDGARADYDRAQQRLQRAQSAAQGAQGGLVAARQQALNPARPAASSTPAEQVVAARASSAGTVSVVSVKQGDRVTAGQPLATLRAGNR